MLTTAALPSGPALHVASRLSADDDHTLTLGLLALLLAALLFLYLWKRRRLRRERS